MADLPVISLFSGALGLDLGLEQAGFRICVAVECNRDAAATIRANRPDLPLIEAKLEDVSTEEILKKAGLRPGQPVLVTGGPSCQTFSTAGQRVALQDQRGNMFREFLRVVREARPRFFCMENVRGILSAAVQHRPLRERGPGWPKLGPDEELGSALKLIVRELALTGYYTVFDLINAADYGVPQTRERVIFLGSRYGEPVEMPKRTHAVEAINGTKRPWVTLREGLKGLRQRPKILYTEFSPKKREFLEYVPAGGNWRDLPEELHEDALGGAFHSWGGRTGFYRRLAWDAPCPALTTRPDSKATMFCHPSKTRPLSVQEYARIQQFPDCWKFSGSLAKQYVQVGNAVPCGLGKAIGGAFLSAMRRRERAPRSTVVCADEALLDRLAKRPRTVLNPPRMWKVKDSGAAVEWLKAEDRFRSGILELVVTPEDVELTTPGLAKVDRPSRALRNRARRVTEILHEIYGSPDHGNKADPVDELVFILLSQMTTGPSYERVYEELKDSVGSWEEFQGLRLRKVRSLIKDAGLSNQKAPRLREALRSILKEFGELSLEALRGKSDREVERYLCSLPGVGVKTAKCIMLYSFQRDVLPVDTHVRRIAERLELVEVGLPPAQVHEVLETVVEPCDRYAFHVNALAHGRARCLAKRADCDGCPLVRLCPTGQRERRGRRAKSTQAT